MHDNIELKDKLGRSFLIQRLQKPYANQKGPNPFAFGSGLTSGGLTKEAAHIVNQLCNFDYMGSAEFEYGSIPAWFRFIIQQSMAKNVVSGKIQLKENQIVYYICPSQYEEDVKLRIAQLYRMDKEIRLKEHCGLKEYFNGWDGKAPNEYQLKNIGWLELDNGFAFFTNETLFVNFCNLFGIPSVSESQK